MLNFIEVHFQGKPILVNTYWIEEVSPEENGCTIYLAFTPPNSFEQDYIKADESYEDVKLLIWR